MLVAMHIVTCTVLYCTVPGTARSRTLWAGSRCSPRPPAASAAAAGLWWLPDCGAAGSLAALRCVVESSPACWHFLWPSCATKGKSLMT